MQISVHTDMKSTKKGSSQLQTQKSIQSWPNHFWNPIANVSVKVQYEKTSIENLKHSCKKTHSINGDNYTNQYNQVKEKM